MLLTRTASCCSSQVADAPLRSLALAAYRTTRGAQASWVTARQMRRPRGSSMRVGWVGARATGLAAATCRLKGGDQSRLDAAAVIDRHVLQANASISTRLARAAAGGALSARLRTRGRQRLLACGRAAARSACQWLAGAAGRGADGACSLPEPLKAWEVSQAALPASSPLGTCVLALAALHLVCSLCSGWIQGAQRDLAGNSALHAWGCMRTQPALLSTQLHCLAGARPIADQSN